MYKFEKLNEDTYKLIINDKEYTFTRTINLAKELQSVDLETTLVLADMLAERGETFENTKLKVERQEGNKTIIDETNFNLVKQEAAKIAYYNILERIFKKIFHVGYMDLIIETGLTKVEDITKFVSELTEVLINGIKDNTPRE